MADEIISAAADDAGEPTRAESPPAETASPPADEATPKSGWSRRAFFQAAALGAAAAAFLDGKCFVPSIAFADDLGSLPCTANDIDVGAGTVINPPCSQCSGTFDATVTFPVTNNTGSLRYCVTVHIPDGFGVPSQAVVLGGGAAVPANSTV